MVTLKNQKVPATCITSLIMTLERNYLGYSRNSRNHGMNQIKHKHIEGTVLMYIKNTSASIVYNISIINGQTRYY